MKQSQKKMLVGAVVMVAVLFGASIWIKNEGKEIAKQVAIGATQEVIKEVKTEVNATITEVKAEVKAEVNASIQKAKPKIEKAKTEAKNFMKLAKTKMAAVKVKTVIELDEIIIDEPKEISLKGCVGCHDDAFGKKALSKSKVVSNMTEKEILVALREYKSGKRSSGLGKLMAAQISKYSDNDLKLMSEQIPSIPSK